MESIKLWLNSTRPYHAGVRLYKQFGNNPILVKSFEEGESDYKKKRLLQAMQELLTVKKAKAEKIDGQKKKAIRAVDTRILKNGWPQQMDEIMAGLYNEWRPLFMQMQDLCTRLYDVALAGETDNMKEMEAGKICFEILRLDDACDRLYAKRDHYMEHKKLPGDPGAAEIVTDPVLAHRAYANVQRYIRHYKKKLEINPGKLQFVQQLRKYEAMAERYKKELNL